MTRQKLTGPRRGSPGPHPPRHRRASRAVAAAGAAVVGAGLLGACGGGGDGTANMLWYINPDAGGQEAIAQRCTEAAEGAYTISTSLLPRDAASQREQLVRRLAANDDAIALMSLDPPFIPEFAEAGFLAEIPDDVAEAVTEGVVEGAIASSTYEDELVAVPFWANTQLLWFRESVAQEAGLDMSQPVTWDQIITAAEETGTTVGAQGARAESLTVWINALIESAGGTIIGERADDPADVQIDLDGEAAELGAEVMARVAESGVAGPALSTQNEDASATLFEGEQGGFMVNWPFVWPRALGAVEAGGLDPSVPEDYGWALYPAVIEGEPSAPPLGGINIAVGAFTPYVEEAFDAVQCIVSEENQTEYFITNGNPASLASVYDDPAVQEQFPMAETIRASLEAAAPRPLTPYYNEVSQSLQRVWHPPGSIVPSSTPERSAEVIEAVLAREDLL